LRLTGLLYIISLLPCLASAQADTTWFNDKWKKTTKDSAAFFRPPFKKQDKVYLVQDYYKSGQLQMEGFSSSANEITLTGEAKWYEKDGKLKQRSMHAYGQLHGTTTGYYNDRVYVTVEYSYGKRQGPMITYYPSGKIASSCEYVDDKPSGICEDFHENGIVSERDVYVNGKQTGEATKYFPSGKIQSRILYKNGKRNGIAEEFYENGNRESRINYVDGDYEGEAVFYYRNGAVHISGHTKSDLPDGKYEVYDSLQKLVARAYFKEGWLTDSFYHATPAFSIHAFLNNKQPLSWQFKRSTGTTRSMQPLENKVEHWKEFMNGALILEGFYQDGYSVNQWIAYENGKTRSEINFREAYEIKEDKKENEEEEKGSDDEDKEKKFFTDDIELTEAKLQTLFPHYYYTGLDVSDDPDDISSYSPYNTLTRHFFDGRLKLFNKQNWQGDSAFVCFSFPAKNEISGMKYSLHTDPDGLKLIPLKENYRVAANECAVFTETYSDWVEKRILQISLGSKLKKEILREPSKIEWLVEHIEKNQMVALDKAMIANAIISELYAQ
jgi:antitoxin component YwqK of YwqJK toxin-antitoxin module